MANAASRQNLDPGVGQVGQAKLEARVTGMQVGHHGRWSWIAGILCVGGLVALPQTGCLSRPKEPLRIGMNVWPPYELLFLAEEKGFFRDEGVEVELVDFSSFTGVLRTYHLENIDGFLSTLGEVQIRENFQDLPAVVLVADYSYGADALVARKGIAGIKDLRGKRIAYEESALGSYFLGRILEIGGLAARDVKAYNRLAEEGEQDFRRGAVDAVISYEPEVANLVRNAGGRAIFTSRDLPGEIVDVLALRRTVLKDRGDDARALVRAWFRALDYLETHPEDACAVMALREQTTPELFRLGLQGTRIPDVKENLALLGTSDAPGTLHKTTARLAKFLKRQGLTRNPASGEDLLDPDLIGSMK
jgi:NitT/TauT family transport system substrate-binding protein